MGKCILVTGGARSGKSSFSENMAKSYGEKVIYIATAVAFDSEMEDRIKKHKESRSKEWRTIEAFKDIDGIIHKHGEEYDCFLLDCITVMVTNQMLEYFNYDMEYVKIEDYNRAEESIKVQIGNMLEAISKSPADTILVSNEVGWGIVPENPVARAFRDISGRINQIIGQKADEVYLTVSGIPIRIK
ncbi:bifunctional adenosylcobinamide kinase/adenosylcobinamide-phosphate guanylyltransferase [Lutispora sp.]|uniref:bifunctional adenosylcobinamide kinase/adenosylcobinamide-phosphate guanylyltransferase n=1 Tax=Lutispora sp. TaxID=2828727 RepID=UPI000EC24193|nr:bifunctional adenosylcobinamide kinase/adenosylcobinamide-phosphate guanylyltransferase [Lutispora sp.]MEA4960692.1 bifunctional adenosylcobinamide kinase/adenosylcobinamide-phosphate guanylyltransferase [Lutispora sp.]HCJ58994.1 bifunctional adenosylcobinamide kinase/adenosylcobinamide-phosphate guanylyltransferase [Clostridiaceae bacterium]